jgi:hypothetical protein
LQEKVEKCAVTITSMTFSITTLRIIGLIGTVCIMALRVIKLCKMSLIMRHS